MNVYNLNLTICPPSAALTALSRFRKQPIARVYLILWKLCPCLSHTNSQLIEASDSFSTIDKSFKSWPNIIVEGAQITAIWRPICRGYVIRYIFIQVGNSATWRMTPRAILLEDVVIPCQPFHVRNQLCHDFFLVCFAV